ncbi:MAG: peptidoglycan editing factor PgeF [Bryobacteraceae bacterium]
MRLEDGRGLPGPIYVSTLLEETPVDHGFGTRDADPWDSAAESAIVTVRQTHSSRVLVWEEPQPEQAMPVCLGEGDALVTDQPGVWLTVKTADCVPVLLAHRAGRAVGAAHAGWRGVASEIVPAALAEMTNRYGVSPSDVVAAIGPAIGRCCFEVGPEVARQFGRWWPPSAAPEGKQYVDLAATLLKQLKEAGVPAQQIDSGAPCTKCRPGEFHSFRRDQDRAGRMRSAIRIRPTRSR